MKNILIFTFTILMMIGACNQPRNLSPEQWNEQELSEWFNEDEWRQKWHVHPDESINKKELATQFFKSKRWEKAFDFLKNQDLAKLEPGRYEIEGSDLFVNIDEYTTKNEEDARFEAHRKYADIQYVVYGEEKIGLTMLDNTKVTVPYDSINDIMFLSSERNNYRSATPDKFFVFFPNDAHRPGVKTDTNSKVRKVVVKVRIN